jgi:hypothetical protein
MFFHFTLKDKTLKRFEDLQVGDLVLCDDGLFYPIKNLMVVSCYPTFYRLSNGYSFYTSPRMLVKTTEGFKQLELWDTIELNSQLTPQIVTVKKIDKIMFFRDILIDGNMLTVEGIVFKYSSQGV